MSLDPWWRCIKSLSVENPSSFASLELMVCLGASLLPLWPLVWAPFLLFLAPFSGTCENTPRPQTNKLLVTDLSKLFIFIKAAWNSSSAFCNTLYYVKWFILLAFSHNSPVSGSVSGWASWLGKMGHDKVSFRAAIFQLLCHDSG